MTAEEYEKAIRALTKLALEGKNEAEREAVLGAMFAQTVAFITAHGFKRADALRALNKGYDMADELRRTKVVVP
jgi:hypothetical protein